MEKKTFFICAAAMVLAALALTLALGKCWDAGYDAGYNAGAVRGESAGYIDGWHDALKGECATDSRCWDMYHACEGYGTSQFCE